MGKQVRFVGHSLMDVAVPKARKPKFELVLKIIDLNNVPLVSGTSYVKWHLPHSSAAEHRGKTHKAPIKDHKVVWDYERVLQLRVIADKDGMLQDTEMHLEVVQEYASGPRAERITLGSVAVNLAEYVGASSGGDADPHDGITRRYLMQDSKINSTLKVCLVMTQIEGDKNFTAPPLKSAPLFSGIAGIMSVEQAEQEDSNFASGSYKFARDNGEMQDLYRRTLTASYSGSGQDLAADECIEDIFSGGDGWGRKANKVTFQFSHADPDADSDDVDFASVKSPNPANPRASPRIATSPVSRPQSERRKSDTKTRGSHLTEQQANSSSSEELKNLERLRRHDVSEFDLRDDLRSWKISPG